MSAYDRWTLEEKSNLIFMFAHLCAPLSALGSALVLLALYRNQSPHRRVYQRLMAGMSIMDLIMSVAYSFGVSPTPSYPTMVFIWGKVFGSGTQAACSAQSFFIQLGSLSYTYMMFLSFFFVLKIRFNVSDTIISKYVEPLMHVFTWGFAIISATLLVALGNSNIAFAVCWHGAWPPGCEHGFTECERGEDFLNVARAVLIVPSYINFGGIATCLAIVGCTVFQKYRQSAAHVAETGWGSRNNRVDELYKRNSRSVMVQCAMFALSFFNTTFWYSFQNWILMRGNFADLSGRFFFVLVIAQFFHPLQGFFNFLIFVRAPYVELRAKQPSWRRSKVLKAVVWNTTTSTLPSTPSVPCSRLSAASASHVASEDVESI